MTNISRTPQVRLSTEAVPYSIHGRVYVSGPMTGIKDDNFPAFHAAADLLRQFGWDVENPAEKGIIPGWEWEDYLRYDLAKLVECEAIYTLPGWENSRGATLEMHVAKALGIVWLNPPDGAKCITLSG